MNRVARNIYRIALSLVIGLTLLCSPSLPAMADDTPPVDLELGGGGATPWSITDIQPGDSGSKTVRLRNVGSKDGFVSIWVDEIISSEGSNPESEEGDITEPGEFGEYLLFNLTANGLNTNLNLPVVFNNLPQRVSDRKYIEIIPLRAGHNINLRWEWEVPPQTGNEVQGDSISFTINYLLRECIITDVTDVVDEEGEFQEQVTVESDNNNGTVTINQGTTGETTAGEPVNEIWFIEIDREPPPITEEQAIIGLQYEAGPDGATFDEPVTITLNYNPEDIPEGFDINKLSIALWDRDLADWVPLDNCIVDPLHNTISAQVTHFSRYSISVPPLPAPPVYVEPGAPPPTDEEEEPEDINLLELHILDREFSVEIGEDGTISSPLQITDSSGNFVIDIDSGTRITGTDGTALSRIELRTAIRQIAVPENTVTLSPLYELTGYNRDMDITDINITPAATLTISYDPQNLPENSFPPFIANYTDEQGLIRLQSPPEAFEEIGKAKALISHASLFFVAAESAPPPPPLPAKFVASGLTVNPQRVDLGKPVTISLTITNEGAVSGTYELHLIIDGIVRSIEEVTLSGKSSETLTFKVSNLAPGTHRIKVAGLTGEFSVVRIAVLPEESGVNWFLIDGSVALALIIGVLVLYYITRRSRQVRPV